MTNYALGFLFSNDGKEGVLIEKCRPPWQAGKLNGVGGHIEKDESPHDAMSREFREEAGIDVLAWTWCLRLINVEATWSVYIFRAFVSHNTLQQCHTMTDEPLYWVDTQHLPDHCIPNLRWIIPMLQDNLEWPITVFDCGDMEANT